ncbi:hypothetical protein [Actinomadura sp. WMMA1423]|uniref:hypothetical protein n=1 Tax=Actinomadura sp. WMMA1423 TaxID=2591108 RepID=UPI00114661CF|nr:hypothetical protein [Actinomadura sp. WMMA1423]
MASNADPGRWHRLGMALAAYNLLMNEVVVPESQYWQGQREDVDRTAYLGDIVQRAAAREREQSREDHR